MFRSQFVWFLVLAVLLPAMFADSVFGQDEQTEQVAAMTTDRPSFTTDSRMMAPKEYQLELGYTYVDMEHGNASTFPEALFRYGYNEDWELRLGWDGYAFGTEDGDIAGGTDVGFKYKFKNSGENLFWDKLDPVDMALIGTFTLPTGHGVSHIDYEFLIGWNYDLDARMALSGNLGFGAPTDAVTGDQFSQAVASVMLTRVVGDTTSVFGELYTNCPAADEESAEFVLQGGIIHQLSDNMQFDVRLGAGLNHEAPDWLFGLGFAYKF